MPRESGGHRYFFQLQLQKLRGSLPSEILASWKTANRDGQLSTLAPKGHIFSKAHSQCSGQYHPYKARVIPIFQASSPERNRLVLCLPGFSGSGKERSKSHLRILFYLPPS